MGAAAPAAGMRFSPNDEYLVGYYLHRRYEGLPLEILPGTIYDLDVYATEPWNLPSECFTHGDHRNQAFFFTPRHPSSANTSRRAGKGGGAGGRARRTAGSGTWHGQGHLKSLLCEPSAHKTTLTFKKSDGTMTDWLMQEYVLDSPEGCFQQLALCRIYKKHRAAASGRKSIIGLCIIR